MGEKVGSVPDHGMHAVMKSRLNDYCSQIEQLLNREVVAVIGQIMAGVDTRLRDAITSLEPDARRDRVAVVLDTIGGTVEVVERMVEVLRHFFVDVQFIVPDRAMSAGTIFAMSGDSIVMDYFSVLGPIDPQLPRDGNWVPALSYLEQYDRLIDKSSRGALTTAEFTLLSKLDLAELHQYEQARDLSIALLKKWLATYKFKDWTKIESRELEVTDETRVARAEEIATVLADHKRWHTHGRGISRETLQSDEIKLRIDDLESVPGLQPLVRAYNQCLNDYRVFLGLANLVQSREYI